jgi:predicted transcriptional regulator
MTVAELVQVHLLPGDDRALPVVDHGAFLGLVSIADVRGIAPERWATTTVSEIMHDVGELHGATPDEPLSKAFEELARYDIEQLPVVDRGQLVGMLRRRDIARWLELAWKPNGFAARGEARRPVSSPPPAHWPFHRDDRWHHHPA